VKALVLALLTVPFFPPAAQAQVSGFSCRRIGRTDRYVIEVTDADAKIFAMAFATQAQCHEESMRLDQAEVDRSKLPLEICGCDYARMPAPSIFWSGYNRWTLSCFTLSQDGGIQEENKRVWTSMYADKMANCEQERLKNFAFAAAERGEFP
jgi:hypothetical protein